MHKAAICCRQSSGQVRDSGIPGHNRINRSPEQRCQPLPQLEKTSKPRSEIITYGLFNLKIYIPPCGIELIVRRGAEHVQSRRAIRAAERPEFVRTLFGQRLHATTLSAPPINAMIRGATDVLLVSVRQGSSPLTSPGRDRNRPRVSDQDEQRTGWGRWQTGPGGVPAGRAGSATTAILDPCPIFTQGKSTLTITKACRIRVGGGPFRNGPAP
jgi:hypothetical protein